MKLNRYIILHHSVTPAEWDSKKTIETIDASHQTRLHRTTNGYGYHIAYHFCIDKDGGIYVTRPENEIGYHAGNWLINLQSLGICCFGNFEKTVPTKAQLKSLSELVRKMQFKYEIKAENIKGHRDIKPTACPGANFTDQMIKDVVSGVYLQSEPEKFKIPTWKGLKDAIKWNKNLKIPVLSKIDTEQKCREVLMFYRNYLNFIK